MQPKGDTHGPSTKPKIPDVCTALKIPCVRFIDVFRSEGWVI